MSGDSLRDRKWETTEEDERTVVDLLIDQLEFADVVLLNKTDLMSEEEQNRVEALIHRMNPTAKAVKTQFSKVIAPCSAGQ